MTRTDTTATRRPDPEGTDPEATEAASAETEVAAEPAPDSRTPLLRRPAVRRGLWAATAAAAVALVATSGYLWTEHRDRVAVRDQAPAVLDAAREGATAVLSYRAATVDADVAATQKRLTGAFADSYRTLARDQVIPAAKERGLSSQVRVSGVSLVSSSADHAQAMAFVTQSVQSSRPGAEPPTTTATAVRIGLTRHDDGWLIERFDPI